MILLVCLGHIGIVSSRYKIYFSPNQLLGDVLSSHTREPQEKQWCTSIFACVKGRSDHTTRLYILSSAAPTHYGPFLERGHFCSTKHFGDPLGG